MRCTRRMLMTTDPLGGVWGYGLELAKHLAAEGFHITLASMGGPVSAAQKQEAAKVPNLTLCESLYRLEWMDEAWEEVDAAGEWLMALAEECGAELVHLNGYAHAALPWRVPVVVVAHSCVLSWWQAVFQEAAPARYETYRQRVAAGLAAADAIVAPTRAMQAALQAQWPGVSVPITVVPNARDPERYAPARRKERFVFAAGRVWDQAKNVALLDEVATELPWPVLVAGGNRCPKGEITQCRGLQFTGLLSESEMRRRLARATIFASPALYEPFGLSVLEAALSGCALVLSDIPSLRELWGDNAIFLPAHDAAAWRTALQELMAHPGRQAALGEAARQRAQCFHPERQGAGYLSLYGRLLASRAPVAKTLPRRTTKAPVWRASQVVGSPV